MGQILLLSSNVCLKLVFEAKEGQFHKLIES